ncbi:MAG: hypothetical protein ABS69_00280 [Nitrosomonadales bacterium SCN 54-20]|nr:MAG: hypothetical protein ABS69_00280 [Nitrosomonadales bacterium SCN 54-20]
MTLMLEQRRVSCRSKLAGLDCEAVFGRMERRIRNGFGNRNRDESCQRFHANGRGHKWRRREKERLILPGCMKTQVSCCVQMIIITGNSTLVGLKVLCWIRGYNMMRMIQFMSKYLSVKRPSESSRQDGDE